MSEENKTPLLEVKDFEKMVSCEKFTVFPKERYLSRQ